MAGHHDTPHTTTAADNVFSYQFNFQFSKRFRRGLETLECCNESLAVTGVAVSLPAVVSACSPLLHSTDGSAGDFSLEPESRMRNAAAAALKVFLIGHKLRSVG